METVICIDLWRYPNIPNIHNHDCHYDHNHSVSLWLPWIGKIRECHLYFALPLPCGFDQGCFTGRDCKSVSRGGATRVFHGAGPQGCFAARGVDLCPLAPLKVPGVKSSWRISIFCTNIVLQVCPRWSSTLLYYISLISITWPIQRTQNKWQRSSYLNYRWRRPVFLFSRSPPAPWRDCLELDSP